MDSFRNFLLHASFGSMKVTGIEFHKSNCVLIDLLICWGHGYVFIWFGWTVGNVFIHSLLYVCIYKRTKFILNYSNSGNACTLIIKVQVYLILKCLDKGTAVQPSSWGFNLWFLRSWWSVLEQDVEAPDARCVRSMRKMVWSALSAKARKALCKWQPRFRDD